MHNLDDDSNHVYECNVSGCVSIWANRLAFYGDIISGDSAEIGGSGLNPSACVYGNMGESLVQVLYQNVSMYGKTACPMLVGGNYVNIYGDHIGQIADMSGGVFVIYGNCVANANAYIFINNEGRMTIMGKMNGENIDLVS